MFELDLQKKARKNWRIWNSNEFILLNRKYYIGFKLTMAVDYPIMRPLTFLLHSGFPHDFRLFEPIMEELQKKRIICEGDIPIFDK